MAYTGYSVALQMSKPESKEGNQFVKLLSGQKDGRYHERASWGCESMGLHLSRQTASAMYRVVQY